MSREPTSVLIVEDEAIVAADLCETLDEMGYRAVGIAASADDALRLASERRPDVVLMDVRIDGTRDGIETAALLRERFEVPVLYLTAHGDPATVERAKRTEPYAYLTKPVSTTTLRNAIDLSVHRHASERKLRERERWFSTTLRAITDAVMTVDLDGRITFMNPAAEALLGTSLEACLGRDAETLLRFADAPSSPLRAALLRREAVSAAPGVLATSAGARSVIEGAAPVVDGPHMLGAVIVLHDVTEERRAQVQLEVTQRLASIGTMAAGVAHELNNPLAVVMANASFVREILGEWPTLTDEAVVDDALSAQSEIESAAARIARIVAELQTFARPTPASAGEADVEAAISWAVRSTSPALRDHARVVTDVPPLPKVQLDEARLGQVLINLLVNAGHAIPPGDRDHQLVKVVARASATEVAIEVSDTGTGMSEEVQARIFEPFFTTKPVGVGTGLGLSICHGIVTSARGRMEVRSAPGAGTLMRVVLPIAVGAAPVDAARDAPHGRRGRILIVDDEPMLLRALERTLAEHEVTTARDGAEAIARIEAGASFDVILTDITMPTVSGIDLYEHLAARFPDQAARVVFMTGGAPGARAIALQQAGRSPWLQKPLSPQHLRAFVQEQLARLRH